MTRRVVGIALALVLTGCGGRGPSPSASPAPSIVRPAPPVATTPGPPVATTPPAVPATPSIAPTRPPLPASLVGSEWSRLPTTQKVVALTFDAGNNNGGVASILATLRATGTPATFFLNGRWVQAHPADARQIAAGGYSIGNHSADLTHFATLSDPEVRQQVLEGERIINSVTGVDPRPWFRSPFGDLDARTIKVVNSLGYGSIFWTTGTQGYLGTSGGQSVSSVVARFLGSLQPGEIVILEVQANATDGSTLDADALPTIIREVRQRGYDFVSLDQFTHSNGG